MLTDTTVITAGIQALKTGLMVNGTTVLPAEGMDTTTDTRTVTFSNRRFFGITTSSEINESVIEALSNELGGKSSTKENITTNDSQYYVYAYPTSLGELEEITQDDSAPILGAFTKSSVSITNNAGVPVELYVYRSNHPGAFNNVQLQFI